MWHELGVAICLLFVLEGMLPFLSPEKWRLMLLNMMSLSDSQIRVAGLLSMVVGVVLLTLLN